MREQAGIGGLGWPIGVSPRRERKRRLGEIGAEEEEMVVFMGKARKAEGRFLSLHLYFLTFLHL